MNESKTYYVTKYALTSGILELKGRVVGKKHFRAFHGTYYHGNDFHETIESAIRRAEEMRIKKLQSLDKQIKKISALKF